MSQSDKNEHFRILFDRVRDQFWELHSKEATEEEKEYDNLIKDLDELAKESLFEYETLLQNNKELKREHKEYESLYNRYQKQKSIEESYVRLCERMKSLNGGRGIF